MQWYWFTRKKRKKKRLVAYLLTESNAKPEPTTLRKQLTPYLPEYMLPSAFVILDTFPLTPNGKLDRQALPLPDHTSVVTHSYEAPEGEIETTLAQLWQALLGIERIGRYDHFFELGGHSLMMVNLAEQLRRLGWSLDIRTLFATPILTDMVKTILTEQDNSTNFTAPPNLIPDGCTTITPDMLPLISLSQSEIDTIAAATPDGAANIQDIYPLVPLQEGILFHHLLQTQGDMYLLHSMFAFDTRAHLDTFLSTLQQLIDHHDILRTAVYWQGLSQPVQVVWRRASLHINTFVPSGELDVPTQLLAHIDPNQRCLDVNQAPLFSVDIARDPQQNEWLLALSFHHLISDHLTLELFIAEISEQMHNYVKNHHVENHRAKPLPPALPYRHFVAQTLSVPESVHEAYFHELLADVEVPTSPFGIRELLNEAKQVMEATQRLPPTLAKAIHTEARHQGVSPSVLFHVAWAQVLAHTSGQNDIVFGTVLLGRMQGGAGINRVLGLFINTLPVRISLSGNSAQTIVQAAHYSLTQLLEHEQASLTLAQRCSGIAPPLPLFCTLLNYRHSQEYRHNRAGVRSLWKGIRLLTTQERTNYPISLSVDDLGESFHLTTQAAKGIDPVRLNAYMITALEGLVMALKTLSQMPILNISILPTAERQQLLVEFNATQADFPQHMLIHQSLVHKQFEAQVQRNPDAIAVVFEAHSLSYRELNQRANRLAHHLISLGVHPDDHVAICVERSLEMVVGLLGILKAGGAYVPLDPAYPPQRLMYMLNDATPVALITHTGLVNILGNNVISMLAIPVLILDSPGSPVTEQPSHNPDSQSLGLMSHHLACVIYTSGSTGQPKGVMVEHRNIFRLIINNGFADIGPDDCIAHCASASFDAATWEIWAGLVHGARILLIPEKTLLEPASFGQCLSSEGVSALFLTTALFNQYVNSIASSLSGLRYLLFGGEQADIRPVIQLRKNYPPTHLLHMYGPTETTTFASAYEVPLSAGKYGKIPIGRPIANRQIYILDTQEQPVPLGVTGEIYIAGDGVTRGYLNRPDLTAERFLPDPFSNMPAARMYRTGDLGCWLADGNIEYLGRNDFQVKLRGFRIELGEIETKLMQCYGVREAVVIVRENKANQQHLVAYLLAEPNTELKPAKLRQQLVRHLAEYMIPSAFVTLDSFPLTPNGKLDRQALSAPDQTAFVTSGYADPINNMEMTLAEIWQTLLGVEKVGRYDHFFELGGHSLLAIQLSARVRQKLAREMPLQQLFTHPILADLAVVITDASKIDSTLIPVAERSQPIPLALAQQRLWFLAQLDPASSLAYHTVVVLRLNGHLDLNAFTTALDRLVARHEILRTHFILIDEHPCQQIAPADCGFALNYQDLRSLTATEQQYRLTGLMEHDRSTPFDFAHNPLIRGQLLQLADEEHILLFTQHHIISDGWSSRILFRELGAFYRMTLEGLEDPLPPLPIQYADYAVWQREWLRDEILTAQRDYWRMQLQGIPGLLKLPTDYPRPPEQRYIGSQVPVHLDINTMTAIKALGKRQGTTLFMTLLAAWAVVLARMSGQNDIVIGTPVANRHHRELEDLIGFFVNTLPLRIELASCNTVTELLAHIRERTLAAYDHQDLPFEQVVDALQPIRSLSYSPIFQVMLALDNTPLQPVELSGLSVSLIEQTQLRTHFDLKLSLTETAEDLHGHLEYSVDLFDHATIERMVGYFTHLLTAMATDEMQTIHHLSMLPATERQHLLVDFNAPQTTQNNGADFPQEVLIHQLFEAQVQRTPESIAVIFGEQSLSYRELNQRANRLAHHLIAQGVRPDDRIALCTERSLDMMVGLLGILKAGAAYIPLDPAYPAERLAYMLNDAKPVLLLTQTGLIDIADCHIPAIMLDDLEPLMPASAPIHDPDIQALGLTSHHLAYVIYTSGSTGQPKGVMVEHRGVCNYLQWALDYGLTEQQQDGIVSSPLAFDATITSLYLPLLCGGKLRLLHDGQELAELLPALLSMDSGALVKITPSHLSAMGLALKATGQPCPAHCFVVAGDTLPHSTVALWRELSPESRIINEYGPTETVVGCTIFDTNHPSRFVDSVPIGQPIANTQIYILDAGGQPAPLGVKGEIHIGGVGVARGYLNRPELTAERFLPDPFASDPNVRMYKTGDLARWLPDGNIEYLGRNDFQVKLRGFRIELGEIEARLNQCRGVREAIVLACEGIVITSEDTVIARENIDHKNTPDEKRLVAYLLTDPGVVLVPTELRQQLVPYLPEYMLPSAFVTLDAFPLTPNGKLDRQALPLPDQASVVIRDYEPPVGELETTLAEIWQALLGLEHIGRHDQFFELGGHSLMIVSLIEKIRRLGWTLDIRTVFAKPVLAEMAQAILTKQNNATTFIVPPNRIPDGCNAITPEMLTLISLSQSEIDTIAATLPNGAANIQDIYPLVPLQEGILFHSLLQAQGDTYLLRNVLAFDNRAYLDNFLSALQQVIDRHDILRTAICWQGLNQPAQVVWRQASLPINTFTPSDIFMPNSEKDVLSQLLAHTDPNQRRLDLNQAPLFSVDIAYDPQLDEWLLVLCFHHLVSDHMTLELLIAEISELLHNHNTHLSTAQPYRNFVAQTLSVPASTHEAYFREILVGMDKPTAPFDVLDVRSEGKQITEASQPLAPALATAIRIQARTQGVSPSVLFHVAWAQVLAKLCGQNDVVFGTVLQGRMQGCASNERVLGLFINTLPMRFSLAENSVQTIVQTTHHNLTQLLGHEQAPLSLAQQCSGIATNLALFSTLLNYRHDQPEHTRIQWEGIRLLTVQERTNYPISLSVNDLSEEFHLVTQAVTGIDPARLNAYMTTALTSLVNALETAPKTPIMNISILPATEYQQMLVDFNTTQADFPQDALIHQLFEAQVQRNPDAIAVIFKNQSLSYHELNYRANQLAHYLIALGVQPDDRVALCAERSPAMVVGLLAILKAGGAYVPLDPTYPTKRLAYMLNDAAPIALLVQKNLVDRLASSVPTVLIEAVFPDTQEPAVSHLSAIKAQPTHNPDRQALGLTSRHLAYVIYTSGSTGQPKGVMVEHRNVVCLITNNGFADISPEDCIAHCANISFDATTWEVWAGLIHGARILLIPEKTLLEPTTFGQCLSSEGVSALFLTTALFNQYASLIASSLSGLRYVLFGGEQADIRPVIQLRSNFPPTHLLQVYGPTEATTFATAYEVPLTAGEGGKIPIGSPIANTRIYILDAQSQPVPFGVAGEIHIAGAGVARGYLNHPELTAECFLTDPFASDPNTRMYKTGDLGRWRPDGNIEYLGRNDFQVKLRGFRIEPGEIEMRLTQCHGVCEALVLVREDEPNQKRLVAYVQPQSGIELVPAELRQQLALHLAEYMLPSAFIMLEKFPLTPNGKIDRQALPAPNQTAIVTHGYESPIGEIETTLAQIWQTLLGLEHVGRHDHFFELGGHSLMIISLIERLRNQRLALSIRTVFDTPVLAGMAQAILAEQDSTATFIVPPNRIPDGCTAITPDMLTLITLSQREIDAITATIPNGAANIQDIYPLAPLQEGILFHHSLQTQGDTYLLYSLLAFDTRERLDTFLTALQQIINRHDILRTSVCWLGLSQPVQVVWRQASLRINTFVPSSEEDAPAQLLAHIDPNQHCIDMTQAPLLTADIAHDAKQSEWLLALRSHHLICDHLTQDLIVVEINELLYQRVKSHFFEKKYVKNQRTEHLPPALPYRNFIAQTLHVPASAHEAYFREMLTGINVPTAPFGMLDIYRGDRQITEDRKSLDATLASTIRTQTRHQGVSPSVLFHVAWALVLAKLSGQEDVVFGTILLGRMRENAGIDRGLGLFINTLPIRISLAGLDAQNVIQTTFRHLITLLEHEQAPLALAQRCSSVPPSLPLFNALLNYRHIQSEEIIFTWEGIRWLAGHERSHYPIDLSVDDLGEGFRLIAQTVESIEPDRLNAYMTTALTGLVNALETKSQQPILNLSIIPACERQQILVEFNTTHASQNTEVVFPQQALVHQLFEAQATHHPEATAVVCGEQALSYGELNRRANGLAHYLIAQGVRPDDHVAICVEHNVEMVVGLLAILKSGGAYVPLDPTYPAERLAYMLNDVTPVILLIQSAQVDILAGSVPTSMFTSVPTIILDNLDVTLAEQPNHNPEVQTLTSHHLAYVSYTANSTGQPKGVMSIHQALCNHLLWFVHDIVTPPLVAALQTHISFIDSITGALGVLSAGGKLVVLDEHHVKDMTYFSSGLYRTNVNYLMVVPSLLKLLMQGDGLESIKTLVCSGEKLAPELARQVMIKYPEIRLLNFYGAPEISGNAIWYEYRSAADVPDVSMIGRPLPNIQAYILDAHKQPVPLSVIGEIYIAGVGVARGYLNRPELTAERFLADPFSTEPDARMYKTGDLGRWHSDGNIEYLGHNDVQIKLHGLCIEPGEIETHLTQCHGVSEAVVLAREDLSGEKRLVAYLLSKPNAVLKPTELRQQLALHLADYMIPSAFMILDVFPLTPNGKLDYQALPAPDQSAIMTRRYAAPEGEIETELVKIWQALLGLDRIGRHDNFFELGGHSLIAIRLLTCMQKQNMEVSLAMLFSHPILSELALAVNKRTFHGRTFHGRIFHERTGQSVSVFDGNPVPLSPAGNLPPLFCIPGAGASASSLLEFALSFPSHLSIYALQARGLIDPLRPPHTSVEGAARDYIRAIRQIQPKGPYHVLGHSFGGKIAFEIALQLQAQGEQVADLILIDTTAPDPQDCAPKSFNYTGTLLELIKIYNMLLDQPLPLTRQDFEGQKHSEQLRYLHQALIRTGLFTANSPISMLQGIVQVMQANLNTCYTPRDRYQGLVHLINAKEGNKEETEINSTRWQTHVVQLSTMLVEGNHMTMLSIPNVKPFVDVLWQKLSYTKK
ncbi:non-ribosomal peptide synthetase [Xenorhabdus hominickii]|uniref:Carrier domain-containing protein n=1 Tax=Xenorhabdus hominickii TaxID=351679 RepID=A0ABN4S059_XENHO|nr:non-ribosomal peptide synthetase [Xenorhabdus hominickii]AOM39426.1 hypothetical protein A9255_01710 [Xenorhabdus hominickii]